MRKRNTMAARIFAASMATAMAFSSVPSGVTSPAVVQAAELPTLSNGTAYTTKSEMTTSSVDQSRNAHNWSLYWSDEFGTEEFSNGKLVAHSTDGAGSTLEGAAWSYMIGNGSGYSGSGWGNAELEYYTDDNTTVTVGDDIDGGALVITAEKDNSYAGSSYTSTRLWTMDDGNLTECDTVVADGKVSFKTDHFSTYIFAEKTIEEKHSTMWIVMISVLLALLGVAVFLFVQRKIPPHGLIERMER